MLARCKSHHTVLVGAAAPSSECPPSLVPNSESPTSLIACHRRCHPSAARKCTRSLLLTHAAAACRLQQVHTIRTQAGWVLAAQSAFFVPGDVDL